MTAVKTKVFRKVREVYGKIKGYPAVNGMSGLYYDGKYPRWMHPGMSQRSSEKLLVALANETVNGGR